MSEPELRTESETPSKARRQSEPPVQARGPLRGTTLLLPVWGYGFISQFLEFCLPTLLAPGNIPAVAAAAPCRFVLLSSENDEPVIRAHPAWRALERICDTEIRMIDDLITAGNHSATITLAFARAVRESGDAMLDTCFMFLMSDYLFADGSLKSVFDRIQQGASGVVAGNYQIVAEDAIPLLRRRSTPGFGPIALQPRDLVRWSLSHLHPATVANIVNFGLNHNKHVNRLFWRVDENTLIGRFYLMHMIGIRPEVTDFVVGASCDYSFIPEMCPSGRVARLADSDEYLVVEMQPRRHESKHLAPGPIEVPKLAASLAEWATAEQRRNVEQTIVYHAADIPDALPRFVAEADAFVAQVRKLLPAEAHPYRHHHYWIGSLAVSRARTGRPLTKADWQFLLGEEMPSGGFAGFVWSLRSRLIGTLPDATRLHPRWPDYGLPLKKLRQLSANGRLLLLAPQPAAYAEWVTRATSNIETLECEQLFDLRRMDYLPLVRTFDACLMVLTEEELKQSDGLVGRVGPLLKPGGQIMVMVTNNRSLEDAGKFGDAFAYEATRLLDTSAWLTEVNYVPASRARWVISRLMMRLAQRGAASQWDPALVVPLVMAGGPLLLGTYLCNLGIRPSKIPPRGFCSSIFLILRRAEGSPPPLPIFRSEGGAHHAVPSRGTDLDGAASAGDTAAAAHEPAGEIDRHDPDRLAAVLARYRFVAGLLKARQDVAQYGAHTLGLRLLLKRVRKITLYDPDPTAIYNTGRHFAEELPVALRTHDILAGPLPRRHDAFVSLDTLQYVSRSEEDVYSRNVRRSLAREHDLAVVGCPHLGEPDNEEGLVRSLSAAATQAVTVLSSEIARRDGGAYQGMYVRSGEDLKALFQRHFHEVFIFSMVDNVVHSGVLSLADYVFALCCGPKR
jgi:hypothetical protein